MQWLEENDELSMDYVRNAYERDRIDKFPHSSDHTIFSNSVVDIFTLLNQCNTVLSNIQTSNSEVWNSYMKRYAKVIFSIF